jgi:hypothetical protein
VHARAVVPVARISSPGTVTFIVAVLTGIVTVSPDGTSGPETMIPPSVTTPVTTSDAAGIITVEPSTAAGPRAAMTPDSSSRNTSLDHSCVPLTRSNPTSPLGTASTAISSVFASGATTGSGVPMDAVASPRSAWATRHMVSPDLASRPTIASPLSSSTATTTTPLPANGPSGQPSCWRATGTRHTSSPLRASTAITAVSWPDADALAAGSGIVESI